MGQVHYEDTPLKDLIERSDYIFVVKKLEPSYTVEEIKIHQDIKKYPPFKKVINHFNIEEELFNKDKACMNGKDINIISADFHTELLVHKMYYLEGTHKSPIYSNYESSLEYGKANELIIFLRSSKDNDFAFTCHGAYEAVSKKQEIVDIIKRKGDDANK